MDCQFYLVQCSENKDSLPHLFRIETISIDATQFWVLPGIEKYSRETYSQELYPQYHFLIMASSFLCGVKDTHLFSCLEPCFVFSPTSWYLLNIIRVRLWLEWLLYGWWWEWYSTSSSRWSNCMTEATLIGHRTPLVQWMNNQGDSCNSQDNCP